MANKSIAEKINELKKKKNAVILAHNYQIDEVQDDTLESLFRIL